MPSNRASQARARSRRSPRPLPPGRSLYTEQASPARQGIEQRSATSLLWLHQMPRWTLPLLAVALLVTGLAVTGLPGGIALFALALVLTWLAAVSWPRVDSRGRILRVVAIAVVLGAAIIRVVH